jgi:hypothetical protein|tara:strand:- start:190 stop:708 length:519 start_codon:yes stop_codon:yes gene_type:complete
MSGCPYKNFRKKIDEYISLLRKPREEYSGLPACPFVGKEVDTEKLMIEIFDPSKSTIVEMVEKFSLTHYDSALFIQIAEDISESDTEDYEMFLNKRLKDNNYGHLKCICFNPNDTLEIDGFNPRKHAPYFLINIAERKVLTQAHDKLTKTKYYDKMDKRYLEYLGVKKLEEK